MSSQLTVQYTLLFSADSGRTVAVRVCSRTLPLVVARVPVEADSFTKGELKVSMDRPWEILVGSVSVSLPRPLGLQDARAKVESTVTTASRMARYFLKFFFIG